MSQFRQPKSTGLEAYALDPVKRKDEVENNAGKFYEYSEPDRNENDLKRRSYYHRDRDRIIWSTAFRRLQNKTQVFGHDDDDHFRRRLTHSIEVSSLACSIAKSLNLNEVATDAIALGHDIGHTPFGHAGEEALNNILCKYSFPLKYTEQIPLVGFDHCAHAIEVISRIETFNGTTPGLNLTYDIRDGILKHIYFKGDEDDAPNIVQGKPYSSLESIVKCTKYNQYTNDYGSLEAQCVWFADKLVYLFGDLEDAIRAKVFKFDFDIAGHCEISRAAESSGLKKVLGEKFTTHYKEKGMNDLIEKTRKIQVHHPDDEVRQYLFWRNKAITIMLKDCVESTGNRLEFNNINSVADVFACKKRLVDVSDELKKAWRGPDGFYKEAMYKYLFNYRSVSG